MPAGSAFATVIVVLGSASVARLSHVAALAERTPKAKSAKKIDTEAESTFEEPPIGVANMRALIPHMSVRQVYHGQHEDGCDENSQAIFESEQHGKAEIG